MAMLMSWVVPYDESQDILSIHHDGITFYSCFMYHNSNIFVSFSSSFQVKSYLASQMRKTFCWKLVSVVIYCGSEFCFSFTKLEISIFLTLTSVQKSDPFGLLVP